MGKPYFRVAFNNDGTNDKRYVSDPLYVFDARTRFVIPPHLNLDVAAANNIATFMNGTLLSYVSSAGLNVQNSISDICAETSGTVDLRKVTYYFSNGSSTSIAINARGAAILAAARAIKPLLEDNGVVVVCANLVGETLANVNDYTTPPVVFAASSIPTAGHGKKYSGSINYVSDPTGQIEVLSAQVLSASGDVPPVFAQTWQGCVGAFRLEGPSCPGRASIIKHRRLIAQYQADIGGATRFESREMPISDPAAIASCLNSVSNTTIGSLFCLSYRGESRKFIHRLF